MVLCFFSSCFVFSFTLKMFLRNDLIKKKSTVSAKYIYSQQVMLHFISHYIIICSILFFLNGFYGIYYLHQGVWILRPICLETIRTSQQFGLLVRDILLQYKIGKNFFLNFLNLFHFFYRSIRVEFSEPTHTFFRFFIYGSHSYQSFSVLLFLPYNFWPLL